MSFWSSVTLPAPINVRLHRTSSTSFEVTWDPPSALSSSLSSLDPYGQHQLPIAGYRVYYSPYADHDLDRWMSMELGPHTTAEISGLDHHSAVAVQVRARSSDGRYGNLSEVIVSNGPEHGSYSGKNISTLFQSYPFGLCVSELSHDAAQ